jgi:hypothetical protein
LLLFLRWSGGLGRSRLNHWKQTFWVVEVDGAWVVGSERMNYLGLERGELGSYTILSFPGTAHACTTVATWMGVRQMVCSLACMDDVVLLTIDCVVSEGSRTLTPQTLVDAGN